MALAPSRSRLPALLVLVRLLCFLTALYLVSISSDIIINLIEQRWGLQPVDTAIVVFSTRYERLMLFVLCAGVLAVSVWVERRAPTNRFRTVLIYGGVCGCSWTALAYCGSTGPAIATMYVAGVFLINSMPCEMLDKLLFRPGTKWLATLIFSVGIGVSEVLLFRPFAIWVSRHVWRVRIEPRSRFSELRFVPAVILASALFALQIPYPKLMQLGEALFMDSSVRFIAGPKYKLLSKVDLTSLALDESTRRLFVCGNGINAISAYDLDDLKSIPQQSSSQTGFAQYCGYSPLHRELYVHHRREGRFYWIDARDLSVKGTIAVTLRGRGETHIVWNPATDMIVAISESVHPSGEAGVVIDNRSREISSHIKIAPGYLTYPFSHPDEPVVYMDFYAGNNGILKYDLRRRSVVRRAPTDERVDKMAIDIKRNELLVASPVHSRVLRYDASSLEEKSAIDSLFGVRTLAVDSRRDLLICGSLLSNDLEVIDLKTHESLARYRVGPWLREITLDAQRGVAYVSSRFGLYAVRYTDRLSAAGK